MEYRPLLATGLSMLLSYQCFSCPVWTPVTFICIPLQARCHWKVAIVRHLKQTVLQQNWYQHRFITPARFQNLRHDALSVHKSNIQLIIYKYSTEYLMLPFIHFTVRFHPNRHQHPFQSLLCPHQHWFTRNILTTPSNKTTYTSNVPKEFWIFP